MGLVRGVLVRKSKLKTLELNFQGREESDWADLDPNTFSLTESERLKNCLAFMVNEFKERVGLHYGITDHVKVTGIPSVFRKDILELVDHEGETVLQPLGLCKAEGVRVKMCPAH